MQTAVRTHDRHADTFLADFFRSGFAEGDPEFAVERLRRTSSRRIVPPRVCALLPCTLAPAPLAARRSAHAPGDRDRHRRHTRR